MSGQRAAAEPYTTRFETEVTAIDGRRVRLDRSYFYAESGGQPADRGRIGDVPVEDVQLVDGEQVHVLAEDPPFRAGQQLLCSIDRAFRLYCMRAHTASHVLYGAGRRLLEDLGYGGFDIGPEKVRVDLETSTGIDDETLIELNELVNRAVWESRSVSWEDVPVAEARERDEIAFNEATEEGAFQKGRVRIVTIESDADGDGLGTGTQELWDVAACGGTHVRNTREIGPVTVLGRSNPGEGQTRVEFAVGPRAIDRLTAEKSVALASSRELGAPIEDVPSQLVNLQADRAELADTVRRLRRDLVGATLEGADPFTRDGREWLATTVDDVDPNDAGEIARELAGDLADVVVIAGGTDAAYAVVAADGSLSAASVVDELTDAFGGGGGGSAELAQAGGFDATPAAVVDHLE